MPDDPGSEPISDDEVLYRCVPVTRNLFSAGQLSPEAFAPRNNETTGISFTRSKYSSIEAAAAGGPSKHGYFIASCRVGDLRAAGMTCVQRPEPQIPGHAEITDLRSDNSDSDETLQRKLRLAELFGRDVQGPFVPPNA